MEVAEITKLPLVLKPDLIAIALPYSIADFCKLDQTACGSALSFNGMGKNACASAPVQGDVVKVVQEVGVEPAGPEDSTKKAQGGPADPDMVTVIFDVTMEACKAVCASGLCGSTFNLKIGIAMDDMVKVAKEAKVGCADHKADKNVNTLVVAGKSLPLNESTVENTVVSTDLAAKVCLVLVKGVHTELAIALRVTRFGSLADIVLTVKSQFELTQYITNFDKCTTTDDSIVCANVLLPSTAADHILTIAFEPINSCLVSVVRGVQRYAVKNNPTCMVSMDVGSFDTGEYSAGQIVPAIGVLDAVGVVKVTNIPVKVLKKVEHKAVTSDGVTSLVDETCVTGESFFCDQPSVKSSGITNVVGLVSV